MIYVRDLKLDYTRDTISESLMFGGFVNFKKRYFTWGMIDVEANPATNAKKTLQSCPEVQSRDFALIPPTHLPRISQHLLDKCLLTDGLELYLDVFANDEYSSDVRKFSFATWHHLITNDSQRYAWERTYRYRINPTPKDSPENSSLIKEN